MGIIATPTPPLPYVISHSKGHHPIQIPDKSNSANSMSQDYHHHQGIFTFSNGFERAQQEQQQHITHQIRRDKLRVQGFEPPPLVGAIDQEGEESGGYETAGMLSEMFNFQPGVATATELLESQIAQNYRSTRPSAAAVGISGEWYGKNHNVVNNGDNSMPPPPPHHHHHHHHQISSINGDTAAAAMQLFLMNPQQQQQQQPRSPSPSPSHPPSAAATTSTLHMLLPNPNPSPTSTLQGFHHNPINPTAGGSFGPSQFTWVNPPNNGHGGVVEGQGLSLSLSSSLQHLEEAAKAEELRMGEGGMFFFNEGGGTSSSAHQFQYKNLGGQNHHHHQVHHVGFGSSLGVVNVLRNSKYVKAAQELLEEFCSVGRGQFKKKFARPNNTNPNPNPSGNTNGAGGGGGGSSSSSKDLRPLSAADRIEHQRRKVKLVSMLDEVDRRYNHYCEQMQTVVNSFDLVMGFGAAVPYTGLAQKAMSRHFRCLKDAIAAQLKHCCELLGEKDAGTSGVTKGETPRLKLLEQSLRQQRAFHQMGMMEQEAWRPQRGLPERSVNVLRAWLFEHFLHPYPSDADKHLLARQTGLSRNQVSNWFINARVRLWKPMVEDMYQQETKEGEEDDDDDEEEDTEIMRALSQATTPPPATATVDFTAATASASATEPTRTITGKRSQINALENDPSLVSAINRHDFSENQANEPSSSAISTTIMPTSAPPAATATLASAVAQSFSTNHEPDTCRRGDYVTAATNVSGNPNVGSTLIRFGTNGGDVSLTLGLRHAGNLPEKSSPLSVRDFAAF